MSITPLQHFYESQQLNPELVYHLFRQADSLRVNKSFIKQKPLEGKILASLFYEPSTRTRFSFESAMIRLGGNILSTENASEFSSSIKGETIEDTVRVLHSYADCIVLRHFAEGTAKKAAQLSNVPIINAGDGGGQHPTQSLLDIYTIQREIGRLHDLKVAIVGDLANGRTARSLCYLLAKFERNHIIFLAPDNLKMKPDIKHYLQMHETSYEEASSLPIILPQVDVVYMTRLQKERMRPNEYKKAKGKYVITLENLLLMRKDA